MNAPTTIKRTPWRRGKGLRLPLAMLTALVLGVAALLLALSAVPTNAQEATPTYTVTDLGIPLFNPEEDSGAVIAFNEVGQVVGISEVWEPIFDDTAWLWQDDGDPATDNFKDLGHLGEVPRSTVPYAINDYGQVVGGETDPSGTQGDKAWLWRDDGNADTPDMQDLTPAGYQHAYAADINNEYEVAVSASGDVFLWKDGTSTKLPALPGETNHAAEGINNLGQIVGYATPYDGTEKPILWENSTTVTELPTLPGTFGSHPTDINDQGLVVGSANSPENGHYTWLYNVNDPNATVTELPAPPGSVSGPDSWMDPSAINNSGQIVGYAYSESGVNIPWLYSGGEMYDIQALIAASEPNWTVTDAIDINDQGQILGYAFDSEGNYPTVLLSPTDIAPSVTSVVPEDGATKVSRDITVTATFSEKMDTATLNDTTVQLFSGNSKRAVKTQVGPYAEATNTIPLTPSSKLDAKTTYTVKIKGGLEGVKDLAGNQLVGNQPNGDYWWTFTTGSR